MSDIQQSSYANVNVPVVDAANTLGAIRPPDMRGILHPVPNWASQIGPGLQAGLQMGQDIAKLPTEGLQLQAQNKQLDTELELQRQSRNNLNNPSVQAYAPGTTTYLPNGQVSRGPVPVNPFTIAAGGFTAPPAAPSAQDAGTGAQTGPAVHPGQQGATPPFTPDDVHDWYTANYGNNAKHVEFNSQTGRYDVTLNDGRVQPVHPAYMMQNTGNWKPKLQNQEMANGTPSKLNTAEDPDPDPGSTLGGNVLAQAAAAPIAQANINGQPPGAPQPPTSGDMMKNIGQQGYGHVAPMDPDPNRFFQQSGIDPKDAGSLGQIAQNPNTPVPNLKPVAGGSNWSGDPAYKTANGGTMYIDKSSGRPYLKEGETDMEEQRLYMGDSQPKTIQKPMSEPQNQQINKMIAEQGFGDATKMNPDERSAAYRMAANAANSKPMPDEAAQRVQFTTDAMDRAIQLKKTISGMSDGQRGAASVMMTNMANQYGDSMPASLKGALKGMGMDMTKVDPQVVQMMQQYAQLRNTFAEERYKSRITDAERSSLLGEIGSPTLHAFPQQLDNFTQTLAGSLSKQVDFGLSQKWNMPKSMVANANLYQHQGISGDKGTTQGSAIPVNSADDYNKLRKGEWGIDSTGKPFQKQ